MSATAPIWHDVECGSYEADLPLWEELAERHGGPILELGCGTGRVALHLARRGHRVYGLDRDPALLAALGDRASDSLHSGVGRKSDAPASPAVEPVHADACRFQLPEPVAVALAPMQFLQLLPSAEDRRACLRCLAAALRPGGLLAAAIVESVPQSDGPLPPLPDVREIDGWVYSSLPVAAATAGERIVLRRLRQTVSPTGELREEDDEIQLRTFTVGELEAEAADAGFLPAGYRVIPETEAHVGSLVVLLERSA
ncbi:MAG TPA: class I SAM-dependent methyltransferase [Solirubrobacterales bacterium]|jgi:SAM-dependent methyltransferase|nr:class I SAM-dependent methyltransferase [Solirubrobacterales bacterium]